MMKEQKRILRILKNRSFQKNKGRNFVAILAIFLTTMMFTTLFTLAQSMSQNLEEMYLRQAGTIAHATTKQITDKEIEQIASHPEVVSYGKSIVVGLAENKKLAGRQVEIRYASDQYAKDDFAYPTTGKMPENKNEIALDTITIERLGIPLILGQTVTLEWKKDLTSSKITSSTFTLCGFWEGNLSVYASMAWVSEDFALDACDYISIPRDNQICGLRTMGVTFSNNRDIDAKITTILNDLHLANLEFSVNITYTKETKSNIFMENLPMYGGMVLVFLAGFFIIFNVFQISVASDILFYGKLKTLGMTKKQMKRLIYGQGNKLSFLGIPIGLIAGYLLGIVLVPILINTTEIKSTVSANPVIFIGSALFAYITVMISCMLPARLAGKVSLIEALRYTDADTNIKKKCKKTKHSASLFKMAWANVWRNHKRTVMVICSLTLGLVLMSFFYAKNASFDMEKYLMDLTVADYELDDATNNSSSGYNPESQTISDTLLYDIKALGKIQATGRLYSRQVELTLSEQTKSNLKNYYTKEILEEFASYDPVFPLWKEGFDLAIDGNSGFYTVYGADGLILETATNPNYILDGTFDMEKFAAGNYCLAIGPAIEATNDVPTYSIGEKVKILDREFEVMAIISPLQPMVAGKQPSFDLPLVLPADIFYELWPESNLRKFYFNVAEEAFEEVYTLLTDYQQNTSIGMNIISRQTMEDQYKAEIRSTAVMGYAISMIIALVGVLNLINSMVTAIISRKKEFAMIQSIGMTKRQLCQMLMFEGLYYISMTLIASYILGFLIVDIVVRGMVAGGYATFHFTLMPLVVCTPILIIFAMIIPYICFKNLEKQSVVERLRAAD